MRIAVEVLVPLRLFVCCFLSQHRINLLLALGAVAHLNLNFSKKFRLEVHIMAYNKAREEKKKCDREIISLEEFQQWLRDSKI